MCNLTTWHHLMRYKMRNVFRLANRFKNISQSQKAKAEMKEGIQLARMTYTFGQSFVQEMFLYANTFDNVEINDRSTLG